jgi:hypothetical protein
VEGEEMKRKLVEVAVEIKLVQWRLRGCRFKDLADYFLYSHELDEDTRKKAERLAEQLLYEGGKPTREHVSKSDQTLLRIYKVKVGEKKEEGVDEKKNCQG